jgi:hypothetical protein
VIVVSDAARHVFMNLPDTPAVKPPVECEGLLSAVSELLSAPRNIFAGNLVKTKRVKSLIGSMGLPLILCQNIK